MQQKKKRRLRVSDLLLVIICLLICAASLWFFWKDLNSSSTRSDVDKIATIHFKRKVSQRKFSDRVVWERLQQDSELYNNDTIRTSDGAEAVILFTDGTQIDLNENTMIQIVMANDGVINLAIDGGSIEIDTTASKTESLKLSMNDGSSVNLEKGSRLSADASSGAASSITVRDGNALVSTSSGSSQSIKSGEAVSIEQGGQINKQNVTVTSISKNLKVYKTEEKVEPVKLAWQTGSAAEEVKVQLAADKEFKNILSEYSALGPSSLDIIPREENEKLYWRVYPKDEEEKAVEGQITLVELEQTKLTAPLDNTIFTYRKDFPTLRFAWQEDSYAESYKMEIASTPDFSSPLISESLKASSYVTSALGQGTYYWRVTPYYFVNSIGYGQASPSYSFEIEERQAVTPPALAIPADTAKITLSENEQKLIFSWKSDVKDADYKLLLSANEDFNNALYTINVSQTTIGEYFTIKTLPEGNYWWKVVRSSDDDLESGNDKIESDVRSFTVAAYVPGINKLVYPPDEYAIEKSLLPRMNFSWKIASEYKSSESGESNSVLQISQSPSFADNVVEETIPLQQYTGLNLASGTYYWRVGILQDGKITALSDSRKLNVTNPLSAPQIIQPAPDSRLIVDDSQAIAVEWNEVEGAAYYKLVVYDENGSTFKTEKLSESKIRLELPVNGEEEGVFTKYKLSLQAFSDETELSSPRSGAQTSLSFELRHPIPVKLLSPVENQNFDGLAALHSPIQFAWQTGDAASRSVFTLQKQNSNGSWRTVTTIENPKTGLSQNRLTEGRYRWNISASGENGLVLDSENQSFVIKPVPALATAVLSEPSNNLKMDSAYLRKHRNLSFKWNKVKGASDYTFVIYQVMANGSYKQVYSQKGIKQTEVKIKDLSIFDVGTFEWRVTAYSHAKDGFEEQKSSAASARFKIDFGLPVKVKTTQPGTMYGE